MTTGVSCRPVTVLVLGCGFTGARVARLLAARGERVLGTLRPDEGERGVREAGALPVRLDADDDGSRAALARRCGDEGEGLRVLVAFPPARLAGGGERTAGVLRALAGHAVRVVQLSSTAVYGGAARVDATTTARPASERGALYLEAERAVRDGPWSALVLRAAAIYGPGRGLLAEGGPRFTHARSLDAVVSRIHVDDLAALAAAALTGGLEGVYPAADEEPASGRALLAAWADRAWAPPAREDPPGSRRVDGSAIARALGVRLRYPSFRDALRGDR
jgi:nucleoside-diphosphate-sugar epimerase